MTANFQNLLLIDEIPKFFQAPSDVITVQNFSFDASSQAASFSLWFKPTNTITYQASSTCKSTYNNIVGAYGGENLDGTTYSNTIKTLSLCLQTDASLSNWVNRKSLFEFTRHDSMY